MRARSKNGPAVSTRTVPTAGGAGGEEPFPPGGIRGTRFSASFILACLAEGMTYEDIVREYSDFPRDSLAEVLRFSAEVTDRNDVAA